MIHILEAEYEWNSAEFSSLRRDKRLNFAAAVVAMRDRRKIDVVSWSRFFWCTLFVVLTCVIFTGFTFSAVFRLFFRGSTLISCSWTKFLFFPPFSIPAESDDVLLLLLSETVFVRLKDDFYSDAQKRFTRLWCHHGERRRWSLLSPATLPCRRRFP